MQTRSQKVNEDITSLLRARHTLLWVVTREETRVERALLDACAAARYDVRFWDCADGITDASGKPLMTVSDPSAALDRIKAGTDRAVYVMRDLHKWFDPVVLRKLRSLAKALQGAKAGEARSIVILTPSSEVPPELAGHATVIEYPLPDRTEIAKLLDDAISALPEEIRANAAPNGTRDAAIDAAVGLAAEEASNCYALSLIRSKRIDPALVAAEKKRVIAREKVLTWHDPDPRGLDAVGGLDRLKAWLIAHKAAFGPKARAFGLPPPKGVMLVGLPGCGKSLTAKCVATAYGVPLLRLDMGALKSKYVGESEANIRKALSVAEAVSPSVLWLDEIEKALAGSTGEQGDGGVSADALGAVLSWMQEREGSVFVVATANDVSNLPPELLRKGRFDELFFVDLPTATERRAILDATLRQFNRLGDVPEDVRRVLADESLKDFTGAEVAALIPEALFKAFADGERPLKASDIAEAAATVVPLATTARERIDALRTWAKTRARPASSPETTATGGSRALDFDSN